MKRRGHLFEKVISFENLRAAFHRAFRGTGRTQESCRFHFYLETELLQLQRELAAETYQPGRYRYFSIYDPKERTISVAPFRDRVVHHALVGVLEKVIGPRFIHDTYANRVGKGTHRAVKRAQVFLRKNRYFLKTDVAKYFDNIDHEILLSLLSRIVKDHKVLSLSSRITANSDRSRGLEEGKGLPVGNLTSQFFANLYLDPLDHFIKDALGEKFYIRYMDDLVLFSDSNGLLKDRLSTIEFFLGDRLGLRLKPKATMINTRLHGLPFLGCRVFPGLVRVRQENLKRMFGKIRERQNEFRAGRVSEDRLERSIQSVVGHLKCVNTFNLRRKSLFSGVEVGERLQPGEPGRRLEQQREELSFGQP
ncbi:MAG: reverse transcriptase/maturase family protein [Pseudomonadota bacterium]